MGKATAKRTDPGLWEAVKAEVTAGDKGGDPGEWSARKAQMAVQEYKRRGGGYEGAKSDDNSLVRWEHEEWGTKSGRPSGETGERYLPKDARDDLTDEEYERTSDKKRRDAAEGLQHSAQPADIAAKTAPHRDGETGNWGADAHTKAELMAEARRRNLPGRSGMDKAALAEALAH